MTRLEQATKARLQEIRTVVRSGATERTGKTYRDEGGKIVGRHGGGVSDMYPELRRTGISPGAAAAAVERGKGTVYDRLAKATAQELSGAIKEPRRRSPERPTVAPHGSRTRKCKVCEVPHGKGAHRFHGEGAFHSTHAFAFKDNPMGKRKRNTVIYPRVLQVHAQKVGPHRNCDAECKKCTHKYVHDFRKKNVRMIGLSPGDVIKVPPGKWPLLIIDGD